MSTKQTQGALYPESKEKEYTDAISILQNNPN